MNEIERYEIKKMKIKEIMKTMTDEEKLMYELERPSAMNVDDVGKSITKLIEKYGSTKKMSEQLGIAEDWLNYYVQHLSLNKPAPAIEEKKKGK